MELHEQIRARRRALNLSQADMKNRIGMSQQQYQRIEAGGNPNLETLQLVAHGLNAELMLIPRHHLPAVLAILGNADEGNHHAITPAEDPWKDLLGDLYEDAA
ncbi:MAG: helix-turn-helix domain-containing protein [Gammaproteobacteria bacterium]|nr:helix-turn-helix domain-containing protein [Gammaproteobacteria bacterium]